MTTQFALGLDFGGTKIAGGVVNSRGELFSSVRIATPARSVRKDLAALFDAAHAAVSAAKIPWGRIQAVGVGVPGPLIRKLKLSGCKTCRDGQRFA
jgi:glucokinase